jgi:DNA-binding response OmpR family regulator
LKDQRFLVVDDEHSVADFIQTVIELEGGIAVVAATGERASQCLRTDGPFDLMVLDLSLPDMSGWDLLASVQDVLDGCKVVIFSAQLSEGDSKRALSAGVASLLVKPVAASALRDALRSMLDPPVGQ